MVVGWALDDRVAIVVAMMLAAAAQVRRRTLDASDAVSLIFVVGTAWGGLTMAAVAFGLMNCAVIERQRMTMTAAASWLVLSSIAQVVERFRAPPPPAPTDHS